MAINIRIGTAFDGKGLGIANKELSNLKNSVGALRSNFLIAGAAFAAIGTGLASTVKQASDLTESVNAVNVAYGASAAGILKFGETAAESLGVSQVAFNNAAVRFSAFAERVVGEGGDVAGFIGDISTRATDFASVFNIDVAEALQVFQSGLSGEAEPLKRFGINLLQSEVNAYAAANGIGELGRELTETEKVQARYGLLMESTAKTAGDFANTSDGLANGMRILQAQVADTQAEIGQQLLPVLQEIMPIVQELVAEFGQKLVVAVGAVDWKTLFTNIMNVVTAFVENIEIIVQTTIALFALNTAFKLANVAMALGAVYGKTYAFIQGQIAAGVSLATIATNLFSAALRLIPFVAVIGALWVMADQYNKTKTAIQNATTELSAFEVETISVFNAASRFNPYLNVLKQIITLFIGATGAADEFAEASNPASPNQAANRQRRNALREANRRAGRIGGLASVVIPNFEELLSQAGAGVAAVAALEEIPTFDTAAFAAEQEALSQQLEATNALLAEQAEAARKEQEILDKRENAYKSFADSVQNVFGQIKNSILSSFDLPKLGNSVNSITRNIAKLLDRTKNFARNISELSGLGLNSALLQQVIQAGPMAGSQLAQAIVGGGSAFVGQLNQAYGEFGGLASDIAGVGTRSAFANREVVNNYYQIEVSGGVGSGPTIGKAIVDAIKSYERTSGAVWQGA